MGGPALPCSREAGLRIRIALLLSLLTALTGCSLTSDEGETLLRPGRALHATADVFPRTLLFGDTVTARLVVAIDRRRIAVDRLDVRTRFRPFETIGDVVRTRRDIGHETQLTYTFTLRCDEFRCLPRGGRIPFRFPPARVGAIRVPWPVTEVGTRINESELTAFRYRAILTPLPTTTYRIAPRTLAAVTLGVAAILLVVAGLVGLRLARRLQARRTPELDLPPVERALLILRWTRDGEDRRRALELLAEALDEEDRRELARAARKLAWSDAAPTREEADELAQRVEEARRAAA
jgi:hypothetical protein